MLRIFMGNGLERCRSVCCHYCLSLSTLTPSTSFSFTSSRDIIFSFLEYLTLRTVYLSNPILKTHALRGHQSSSSPSKSLEEQTKSNMTSTPINKDKSTHSVVAISEDAKSKDKTEALNPSQISPTKKENNFSLVHITCPLGSHATYMYMHFYSLSNYVASDQPS